MDGVITRNKESDMIVHYVVDDGGLFNVFSSDMFDSQGRYYEDESINFKNMKVVARFNTMERAFAYADELNDINNNFN